MAECSKDEIPEELIAKKGSFKCRGTYTPEGFPTYYGCQSPNDVGVEYEPSEGNIIAEGPPPYNPAIGLIPSYDALRAATGEYFPLHNVVYEDEYMSWESDVITVADRPPQEVILRSDFIAACGPCCGKAGIYHAYGWGPDHLRSMKTYVPPPNFCSVVSEYNASSFSGASVNIAWFGCSLKFIFNIYKTYCCTLDAEDNIIDYDYYYSFVNMIVKDGKTYLGGDSGQYRIGMNGICIFCRVNKTGTVPGLVYPSRNWSAPSPPLIGRFHIPVKVKEF